MHDGESAASTSPAHHAFDMRRLSLEWEEYEFCTDWAVMGTFGTGCLSYELRTRFHVFTGAGNALNTGQFAGLVGDDYTLRVYRRKTTAAFVVFGSMIATAVALIAGSVGSLRRGRTDLALAMSVASAPFMITGITLLIVVPIRLGNPEEFFDISDADILVDRYNDDLCAEVGLTRKECRKLDRRVTAPIEHP